MADITAVTEAAYKSEFEHPKDTPYLGVIYEEFGENWRRYNGTAL